jgi:hypothetical protein
VRHRGPPSSHRVDTVNPTGEVALVISQPVGRSAEAGSVAGGHSRMRRASRSSAARASGLWATSPQLIFINQLSD